MIVGKNYYCIIAYTVPNKIEKMTREVYIQILKKLGSDLNNIIL